jgi:glycosyltransferase involved in cell wall biosynthesis
MPEISVIIPLYNNAKYIGKAIESVLNQTFTDFEIIVVDDCSTDNSRDVIESYIKKDARVRAIYHERNKGVSAARNTGIHAATGAFIASLDSDDLFLPARLKALYAEIIKNPSIVLVHSDIYVVDEHETIIGVIKGDPRYSIGSIPGEVLRRRGSHLDKPLMRTSCLHASGLYDETLRGTEDYDLYHRLTHQYPVGYVKEPLYMYRLHETNATRKYRSFLKEYKAYLDKTFQEDTNGIYTSLKSEAYSHYFVDLCFVWYNELSWKTFFEILKEGIEVFREYYKYIPTAAVPFMRVLYRRLTKKIHKMIAIKAKKPFTQIGW